MSAIMIVKANVESYDHWRSAFDQRHSFRKEHGVTREEVYCSPEDMTVVLVMEFFDTLEQARSFAGSPDLASAMKASGVIGAPHIRVVEVD